HTSYMNSVAFTTDRGKIISDSEDHTIRIWNAEKSGQMIDEPLLDHTKWVNSVGFSRDGEKIVSGSRDNTIRLFDARHGKMIGEPLQGH
ncbi:WD40-repeat-containing domain protein, partial [Lentinula edodes]